VQPGGPRIFFGGSSPEALPIAAEFVDEYLTWGEPPAQVAEKISAVRNAAELAGRRVTFGSRMAAPAGPANNKVCCNGESQFMGVLNSDVARDADETRAITTVAWSVATLLLLSGLPAGAMAEDAADADESQAGLTRRRQGGGGCSFPRVPRAMSCRVQSGIRAEPAHLRDPGSQGTAVVVASGAVEARTP
jgi:alkanesulfonate monooxygenase SsuD/methylene tetrahydromethanopterin reductase-like flavin-dependent oxidoreductase (luciferase family)